MCVKVPSTLVLVDARVVSQRDIRQGLTFRKQENSARQAMPSGVPSSHRFSSAACPMPSACFGVHLLFLLLDCGTKTIGQVSFFTEGRDQCLSLLRLERQGRGFVDDVV